MFALGRLFVQSSDSGTDIAHKPAQAGWGYSRQYAQNWDKIFGKNKKQEGQSDSHGTTARVDDSLKGEDKQ